MHCPRCGSTWVVGRHRPGRYEAPRCPELDCNEVLLNEGSADEACESVAAILELRPPGYIPQAVDPISAVEVEPGVFVIDTLAYAGFVTDEANGRWLKAPNGYWYIERAKPFIALTAWVPR